MTPVHYAASNNSKDIALQNRSKEIGELLITKGAEINATDIIYQIIIIFFQFKII